MRTAVVLLALAAGAARAADRPPADPVDRALTAVAEAVARHARSAGLGAIGVITADVVYAGDKPAGAGELNDALVRRFEVALVLAADPDADPEPVVLRRPWEALDNARDKVADHRTPAGRTKFFLHKYTPAWGDADRVAAAGLVVLTARMSAKLDAVDLSADVFTASGESAAVPGARATAGLSRRALAELGCGFRADPGSGKVAVAGARGLDPELLAANLPAAPEAPPAPADPAPAEPIDILTPADPADLLRAAPVRLQVFYDGAEAAIDPAGGTFRVRPPRAGERVKFVLTNTTADPVAAVLKVNGENTIERQTLPDDRCRKWVIDPNKSVAVRGFLRANNRDWDTFRVLSEAESEAAGRRYGHLAGTVRLAVFAGRLMAADAPAPADDVSSIFLAVARGSLGGDRPGSLRVLQRDLKKARPAETARGLVVADGPAAEKAVDTVRFELSSPTPVYNLPVVYDDMGGAPKAAD